MAKKVTQGQNWTPVKCDVCGTTYAHINPDYNINLGSSRRCTKHPDDTITLWKRLLNVEQKLEIDWDNIKVGGTD